MISQKDRERAEYLCETIERLSGLDPMVNTRKWDVVSVRMMVAAVLLAESWTLEDVGKYFGKNHSTICHYVKRLKRIDGAGWEAEWDLYQRFLKEISK